MSSSKLPRWLRCAQYQDPRVTGNTKLPLQNALLLNVHDGDGSSLTIITPKLSDACFSPFLNFACPGLGFTLSQDISKE